jgi:hypothetical protein
VTPDEYVYFKIQKGMYGLPQVGIIAQELLKEQQAKYGYHQSKIIPGFGHTKPDQYASPWLLITLQ